MEKHKKCKRCLLVTIWKNRNDLTGSAGSVILSPQLPTGVAL